ncbi:MAG TPA: tetraacyldisaccharide 4'-kinase [Gemmatimonadaceae bacterium]|nr:tetraacyldisaccharide 4'-kinase [Gemmatimonadaceae bacterium]
MSDARAVEALWWGESLGARAGRTALAPLSGAYGAAIRVRNALYDRRLLRSHRLALPAVSVGNLTVGGTGKTPVAAWIASRLRQKGGAPALVLRGYGADEPLVHALLTPGIPVVADPDRVAGARRAQAMGADVAVLDDAFQHRRARRQVDLVLISADRWGGRIRLLPAGPWREPLGALGRASMALVTRKAASPAAAADVARLLRVGTESVPTGVVSILPGVLRRMTGDELPVEELDGARVLAISAIGDPEAFARQLRSLGATVEAAVFSDHHPFGDADVRRLADRAGSADFVVCTLKDAVKLTDRWPRQASPLWYVSQRVEIERGLDVLDSLLDGILEARSALFHTDSPPADQQRSHEHRPSTADQ